MKFYGISLKIRRLKFRLDFYELSFFCKGQRVDSSIGVFPGISLRTPAWKVRLDFMEFL